MPLAQTPRFAFVTSFLDLGGSTTWLCDLAGELCRRGIATHVFSLRENHPLAAEFEQQQIPVTRQDAQRLIYEDRLRNTLRGLRQFQPNIVIGWTGSPSYEVLRYIPSGVLRVGVLHSDVEAVYRDAKPYVPYMDRVIVHTQQMIKAAVAWFRCPADKVRLVRLGVEVPPVVTPRERKPTDPLRILYLGRLDQEQKRVHLFPQILQGLQDTGIPVVWTIAGDGPERSFLEKNLISGGGVSVRLIGSVAYSEIPALLAEHDVLLLASAYEGFPHTLLEAMGHGLVPVVSDLPSGVRDVVDESTGLRVDVNDIAGYARAIHWIATHPQQARLMAEAARARVQAQFSLKIMTDQWLDLLRPSGEPITWPDHQRLKPRLVHGRRWDFYEPVRSVRRVLKRLRAS